MRTLLENQSTLPQGLLFISGPRMEESGWRWAVKNFGNSGARPLDARIDDTTLGTRTPRGSVVRYPGLILQLPPSTLEGSAFVVEASGSGGNNSFFKFTRHDDHSQELAGEKPKPSQASTSSQTISERISICTIYFDVTKHHWPDVPMAAAVCYVPAILLAGLMRRWSAISDTFLEIVHAPKITPEPVTETASWIERLWCVR
jgi:hypothetical protein